MEDKQRLEALVNELNTYQGQAEVLQQQIDTLNATITELQVAMDTLETVKGEDNKETLVPIGAGSFLITELKNTEEVIIGLGAGVAVKKTVDDAKETIAEQKKELEELKEKMASDLQKITEYIMQRSPEAEELMQKVEGEV
ncbi:prefoldin subunit alpha [Methanobacterium spitsbergense]|uniref:Prefoldin subunit alpha n=1 Tax=Methanobacterium spitsbergense TaxID=2874285 RepID=A0A8T5UXT1_9EURY|nr:prefoldin subunit alpha [Methanobacterium spitsbergense]MBZ2165980.1 prefoldin subunit alpha [Methanobacterium spitsbergense]